MRLSALALVLLSGAAAAVDIDADWPDDDLEERIASVSDGELRFLTPRATVAAHRHVNRIRIDPGSLVDGWVSLEQCHTRMDAVPAAEVKFHPERIRGLRVTGAERIGRAWVEGPSVQLQNVGHGARLCVAAESRALLALGEGRYRLRNGPFMRRFLDGYFPMRVELDVYYPSATLSFAGSEPRAQPGFEVHAESGRLRADATFEGRLFTCLDFCTPDSTGCAVDARECGDP
jgi:hypothetical protein